MAKDLILRNKKNAGIGPYFATQVTVTMKFFSIRTGRLLALFLVSVSYFIKPSNRFIERHPDSFTPTYSGLNSSHGVQNSVSRKHIETFFQNLVDSRAMPSSLLGLVINKSIYNLDGIGFFINYVPIIKNTRGSVGRLVFQAAPNHGEAPLLFGKVHWSSGLTLNPILLGDEPNIKIFKANPEVFLKLESWF